MSTAELVTLLADILLFSHRIDFTEDFLTDDPSIFLAECARLTHEFLQHDEDGDQVVVSPYDTKAAAALVRTIYHAKVFMRAYVCSVEETIESDYDCGQAAELIEWLGMWERWRAFVQCCRVVLGYDADYDC